MTAHRTLLVLAAFGLAIPAAAQDERVFAPGELVKPGGGETWKILQCRPEKVSRDTECEYVPWKNSGAAGNALWMSARQIAAGEQRVKDAERFAALSETPAPAPAEPPAKPAVPEETPLPPPGAGADR